MTQMSTKTHLEMFRASSSDARSLRQARDGLQRMLPLLPGWIVPCQHFSPVPIQVGSLIETGPCPQLCWVTTARYYYVVALGV